MLDGVELRAALTHYHEGLFTFSNLLNCLSIIMYSKLELVVLFVLLCITGYFVPGEENEHQQQVLTEDELASLLDTILQEDDRNKDGYIDYAEFMMSQQ